MDKWLIVWGICTFSTLFNTGCTGSSRYTEINRLDSKNDFTGVSVNSTETGNQEDSPVYSLTVNQVLASDYAKKLRWREVIDILESSEGKSSLEIYLLGEAYYRVNDYEKAYQIFLELKSDTGLTIKYDAALRLAEICIYLDSIDIGIAALSDSMPEYLASNALAIKIGLLDRANRFTRALTVLDTLEKEFPRFRSAVRSDSVRAELLFRSGDTTKAVALWRKIVYSGDSKLALKSYKLLEKYGSPSEEDYFYIADHNYDLGHYRTARGFFEKYLATDNKNNRGKARYGRANCMRLTGEYTNALAEFADMAEDKAYNLGWIYFRMAYCHRKKGNYESAEHYIEKGLDSGPDAILKGYLLWEGVELAEDMGDYSMAADYSEKLATTNPHHDRGDNASVWAGYSLYLSGKYSDASIRFARVSSEFSDDFNLPELGLYWQGTSLIEAGDSTGYDYLKEAAESSRRNYYRYLSRIELIREDIWNPANSTTELWSDYQSSINEAWEILSELGYQQSFVATSSPEAIRAEQFARMGLVEQSSEAFLDWLSTIEPSKTDYLALLEIAVNWGLTFRAYRLSHVLVNKFGGILQAPEEIVKLTYPNFFYETVYETARDEGIDPAFIYSVMRRESRFDPYVTSSAGAKGLMQFMDYTGIAISRELGLKDTIYDNYLYDWEVSIRLGARYLANLLREHKWPEFVLAEYNAGPKNLARWNIEPYNMSRAAFVEAVDFAQTRGYIRHVMGDYYAYKEFWN